MRSQLLLGFLIGSCAGLLVGSGAWPRKMMKTFPFEHRRIVGILIVAALIMAGGNTPAKA